MATIRERQGKDGKTHYTARIRIKGKKQESATFTRLTDARKWIQATEAAIREGRHFKTTEAKRRTLGELLDKYEVEILPKKPRSAPYQYHHFRFWKELLGDRVLADVTAADIADGRDVLMRGTTKGGKPRSGSTVNRYLGTISHALTCGEREWGWIESNPVKKVRREKEPPGRTRFLNKDEIDRLLLECKNSESPNLYDAVILGLCTGARRGEVVGLRWGDIDFKRNQITFRGTKSGEDKTIPIAGPALDALRERSKYRRIDTDLVFPSSHTKTPKPVDLRRPFARAAQRAGIENISGFHVLRHSVGSHLAMNGATPHEIAAVLGHKTLAMVKRYSHLSEAHTTGVVNRMVEAVFGNGDAEGEAEHG